MGVFAAVMVLHISVAGAEAPAGRFTINADGTVTDVKTSLTWQRAASAATYTWTEALGHCTGGWRLPSVRELKSIVDVRSVDPAIDTTVFPNTPSDRFWSSTPFANSSFMAWGVSFGNGQTGFPDISLAGRVRCVR